GRHDEATLYVPANHQLLDEEASHDCLARPRVICEQVAQRLAREHLLVDGLDLMRERHETGRVNGQHRVEQVSEPDPKGVGGESEQTAVAVECEGGTGLLET